mgnify:CR=1 FL=1
MNNSTKNDLSGNEVKLDYEALVITANVAVGKCLDQLDSYSRKIRDAFCTGGNTDITTLSLTARYIRDEGKNLAICADTLATLLGGRDRDKVTIINHK